MMHKNPLRDNSSRNIAIYQQLTKPKAWLDFCLLLTQKVRNKKLENLVDSHAILAILFFRAKGL